MTRPAVFLAVAFHWIQMMQAVEVVPFVPTMAVMGVPLLRAFHWIRTMQGLEVLPMARPAGRLLFAEGLGGVADGSR